MKTELESNGKSLTGNLLLTKAMLIEHQPTRWKTI